MGLKMQFKEFICTPKHAGQPKQKQEALGVEDCEDEVSYKRHLNVLRSECRKVKPNHGIVTELMCLTFKQRRVEFESKPYHAEEILDMFPVLQFFDHVSSIVHCMNCIELIFEIPSQVYNVHLSTAGKGTWLDL